jgi:uncharacterized protein YcbK (DUF882 family)
VKCCAALADADRVCHFWERGAACKKHAGNCGSIPMIRQKFGSPIAINSAYRPYTLDIGASRSQHKYGRALDLRPLNGDFKRLLEVVKSTSAIKGIGLAQPSFLHVDIRPEKKRTIFRYA